MATYLNFSDNACGADAPVLICGARRINMFINKTAEGKNNLCGGRVAALRSERKMSQRMLADGLQLMGLDVDKNAIQRIEAGKRFVTDIELKTIAAFFDVSADELIS